MSGIVDFFSAITPILQTIFVLAVLVGSTVAGIFVFKMTKKNGIVQIQNDTIIAYQQQFDVLKQQNADQQEEITQLKFEMKAMRDALKDEGILITVDGEKVTIKDTREPNTSRHIIRKQPTKPVPKKETP